MEDHSEGLVFLQQYNNNASIFEFSFSGKNFQNKETFGQFPLQVDGYRDIHESLEALTAQGEIESISIEDAIKSQQEVSWLHMCWFLLLMLIQYLIYTVVWVTREVWAYLDGFWETKDMFSFAIKPWLWDGEGAWNLSSWKWKMCLSYIVNTIGPTLPNPSISILD